MPGPTQTSNPWADELKRSRRKSSRSSIKGIPGKNEGQMSQEGQTETKAKVSKEKASSSEDVVSKCVKDQAERSQPPKVKPPTIEESRSLYQDARSQLRPVARMLSRSLSKEAKAVISDAEETPVDKLIRQGSLEQPAKG